MDYASLLKLLPEGAKHRLDQVAALMEAYNPPPKIAWWRRNFWLLPIVVMFAVQVWMAWFYSWQPPWFMKDVSGSLVTGLVGGLWFLFLGLHLDAASERARDAAHRQIGAMASRAWEKLLIDEVEGQLIIGHGGLIILTESRLACRIEPKLDKTGKPAMDGPGPGEMSFVVRVSEPPMHRTDEAAYGKAGIELNTYYLCRFRSGSWQIVKSEMPQHKAMPFTWAGHGAAMVSNLTADEYVARMESTK